MDVANAYNEVLQEVSRACADAGRSPDEITLIGVTKTFPNETVVEAARAGIVDVGENRVQELVRKAGELSHLEVNWHMIGHLQTNKVRAVLPLVSMIHSVDRLSLASEISRRATRSTPILLQVNTTGEASKFGIEPAELLPLVESLMELPELEIRGLMTIGPRHGTEIENRRSFASLRALRDQCNLRYPDIDWGVLSMGMSADFPTAIAEGATHIRVGSRIFGPRPRPQETEAKPV